MPLTPHGRVSLRLIGGEYLMTTEVAIKNPIKHYASLPGNYKIPFRIDMTLAIDTPSFYLLIGSGHIAFATGIMDNRPITDILGRKNKPNEYVFNNELPLNAYADISVTYTRSAMWVFVNNECRCIKALKYNALPEVLAHGVPVALACDKRTQLAIQTITVTEYEHENPSAPVEISNINPHPPCLTATEKPTLTQCIQGLPPDVQQEVLRTDNYLLQDMKKSLQCKRKIEGGYPCARVTYTSPHGFRYKLHISGTYLWHDINWISYNTKREQEKYGGYKKADYTQETLQKLAETSPEFADEMFYRIKECVVCTGGEPCTNKCIYEYNGKKKRGCGWCEGMQFKMLPVEFADVRRVVGAIDEVLCAAAEVGQ